jgi:YD repeat-containing protein
MKRIVLIAAVTALVGLSACNQKAEEAPAAAAATEAPAAASMALDGKPDVGTLELTSADGKVTSQTYNADGTLTWMEDGKTMSGKWTKTEPATYCLTMEGEAAATCYTDKMDGEVWTTTNDADPKDMFTIKRIS